jgi:hypothetical protein
MEYGNQHWVPSSYLEAWCDSDCPSDYTPYVWRFPKDGGEGRRKAPHKIFAETDFYTIPLPDGRRDLSVERGLGAIEKRFSRIREARIEKREPLNLEEKVWFCAFVAAMHWRTRAQRDAFREQWGHALRMAEDLQQRLDRMTPQELQKYPPPRATIENRDPNLSINDVRKLVDKPIQHTLPKMIEEDARVLAQMNLSIFTTEDDIGFITSDHPCIWFDPNGGRRPPMLVSPTIEVTMPVSPKSIALLCWEHLPNYRHCTALELDEVNRNQQGACDEYLVARRNASKPMWFT